MDGISVEQQFFYYSLNNIFITFKKNIIKYYRLNKLYFLRKKKNKQSKFIL
jgi:ribosomal protein L19